MKFDLICSLCATAIALLIVLGIALDYVAAWAALAGLLLAMCLLAAAMLCHLVIERRSKK